MRIRTNKKELILYFLLVPYLYPRGFQSFFDEYKLFFTVWLYITMIVVTTLFIHRAFKRKIVLGSCILSMLLYSVLFVLFTIIAQGRINDGLQKLFVAPSMCVLCSILLHKEPKRFVKVISNILILNFSLNVTIFNPHLWPTLFNEDTHINFIGHVQTASQWGVLGILLSCALCLYSEKLKAKRLACLSVLTMIVSKSAVAYVTVCLFAVAYVLYKKMRTTRKVLEKAFFSPTKVIFIYLIMNIFVFWLAMSFTGGRKGVIIAGLTNSRNFIWLEAFKLIKERFLFGYGSYGALIRVFWSSATSNASGMNYAHNEILQQMLNGGLILTAAFVLMLYIYVRNINIKKNGALDYWPYICMLIMMLIMLFESVTEYYYFYLIISIMARWDKMGFNKRLF